MLLGTIELIFLLFHFSFQEDITDRIQQNNINAGRAAQISSEQQQLDASLNKELSNISRAWKPYSLDDQHYYERQYTVSLKNMNLRVDSAVLKCESNLQDMVLSAELQTVNARIEGVFQAREGHARISGVFRSTINDMFCSGTASLQPRLEETQLEWLMLDCPENPPIKTEIRSSMRFGRSSFSPNLGAGIGRRLSSELKEALTTLCTESIAAALKQSASAYQPSWNQAYMQAAQTEEMDSNEMLDAAVSVITWYLERKYNDTVRLPDIKEGCSFSLLQVIRLDTGFLARQGVAHDLVTLQRLGNARITQRNVTIHFAGALVFNRLNIYYGEYIAAVLGIGPRGNLNVTVEPVGVALRLRIDFGRRRIFLDHFSLRKLGKITVAIGGFGRILGHILNELTQFFVGILKTQIMNAVEERVAKYTREALAKNTLDQIIKGEISL